MESLKKNNYSMCSQGIKLITHLNYSPQTQRIVILTPHDEESRSC